MNGYQSVWFMMIASFMLQYFFMGYIMTEKWTDVRFSLGKFYMSCIMALTMGLLELIMMEFHGFKGLAAGYIGFAISIPLFIYLYRNQMYIGERDYLNEMIEHHSMAVLTSEQLLQKTVLNEKTKQLAESISSLQQKEIEYMKKLLDE